LKDILIVLEELLRGFQDIQILVLFLSFGPSNNKKNQFFFFFKKKKERKLIFLILTFSFGFSAFSVPSC